MADSGSLRGKSQRIAPPRGPFALRICAGCGQQINDGHHAHDGRLAPVYDLAAAPLAIIDAAIEDLEAGFDEQWPDGDRDRRNRDGWDLFATALDHLRDAHRTEDMTPSALVPMFEAESCRS